MSSKQPDRGPLLGAPESNSLIGRAGSQIIGIRVEFDTVNICKMPSINAKWVSAGECPEAGSTVMGGAGKIKAARADIHIPYWVGVALVEHSVGEAAQVPVTDGRVLRARQEARAVRQEGSAKHWATVTSHRLYLTAIIVFFIPLRRKVQFKVNINFNHLEIFYF